MIFSYSLIILYKKKKKKKKKEGKSMLKDRKISIYPISFGISSSSNVPTQPDIRLK
jgi:hypothetical protein